jgi:hypothetical protein
MANQGSGMNEVGQLVQYLLNELAVLKAAQQQSAGVAIDGNQILANHVSHIMGEFHILKDAMIALDNRVAAGHEGKMEISVVSLLPIACSASTLISK